MKHNQEIEVSLQTLPAGEAEPILQKEIAMRWRSLLAFWILGLCNNYGYVVMLSAAHDILGRKFHHVETQSALNNDRDCNTLSTGAILLADIIPSLLTKIIVPFFPLCPNIRITMTVFLSAAGYVLVAASEAQWVAILGVVFTAFSSGLGEATLLSYMAFYKNRNVISLWSSGTGGAGFFGSLTYAGLTTLGVTPSVTLYILLLVPTLMGVSFWLVLEHPPQFSIDNEPEAQSAVGSSESSSNDVPQEMTKDTVWKKMKIVPSLLPYMIPIGLVYFFEYFINQGMFELVYFENNFLTHAEQYRWYQVDYQIGVFISRSSVNIIQIDRIWVLALLQFFNVVFFVFASVFLFLPSLWIALMAVLWEGLLGGAAYVNTFHKISRKVAPEKREFSLAITSLADALGITLAGFLSLPAHNYICKLPKY